ncbi:MAG TPA: M23 family metallopeptidase [Phototrophicaceae bacterium]|nr:M23 family metallopeptidase [Phototrophicaceae bacterium]
MTENNHWNEPPIDPLADTNPSLSIKPVQIQDTPLAGWRRVVGLLSLLGAAGLTVATTIILMTPSDTPVGPPPATATIATDDTVTITLMPTQEIPTIEATVEILPGIIPTLNPELAAALLNQPLVPLHERSALVVVRNNYNPFTIVPDRPRTEVIQYTAVQGDTIYTIAERFGLKPESIAWSNSRSIIRVLRPGDVINIPPVDGVYHQVVGSRTIAEIAASFQVSDPYVVLDSEYNNLFGVMPETVLPSGTWVFIPGGQAEQITWNPGVQVESSSGARSGYVSAFAPGDPGSCGQINNPGGGASWGRPLNGYTFMRGFTSWHTGVDLAASEGTPVYAANSGAVIFAGWNSWGYGYTVVLAHGPFLTLYGHLSQISVGCGQLVSVGQVIGGVGSTGNSSGSHLHFEIRSGNTPTDPNATIGF